MSLTWGSWSTSALPDPTNTAEMRLTATRPTSPPSEEESVIQCAIDLFVASSMSQQDLLDLLTPLHDALVTAGWSNVTLSQATTAERSAS